MTAWDGYGYWEQPPAIEVVREDCETCRKCGQPATHQYLANELGYDEMTREERGDPRIPIPTRAIRYGLCDQHAIEQDGPTRAALLASD